MSDRQAVVGAGYLEIKTNVIGKLEAWIHEQLAELDSQQIAIRKAQNGDYIAEIYNSREPSTTT